MTLYQWIFTAAFIAILFYGLYQMGRAAFEFYRDYPRYRGIISRLEKYEIHCFRSGLSLFFIIPILKGSEYSGFFIFQVLAEIGTALAGGLFLIGVISFIRELHNSNRKT